MKWGKKPVICLMGATASGKTALALALAERLPCDLVSVDSALVYRGMDIGTAKPEPEILARYPHALLDIRDPAESYSAAEFRRDALEAIDRSHARGRIPLLVGGTMLYFKALLEGLAPLPPASEDVRSGLDAEAREQGWEALHRRLAQLDPEAAARIHPNDPQRLQRALEVHALTGKTLSELWKAQQESSELPFRALQIGLEIPDRAMLHRRIAERFEAMLAAGFEAEVAMLHAREDLHSGLPALRSVGYRQMWRYLDGEWDYETMKERAIIATRQLGKRQLTWLRRWPGLSRLDASRPGATDVALKLMSGYLI